MSSFRTWLGCAATLAATAAAQPEPHSHSKVNDYSLFNNGSPITFAPPNSNDIMPGEVALPVHLSVIIVMSLLVAILFIAIYIQLIMVVWYGYKLLSYQTVLLFDILLWAALRLTLYSFYYYHCCESVRLLSGVAGWILVAFPAALQFIMLAVLVRYFGESLFKVFERRQEMATLAPPYRKMYLYRLAGNAVWLSSLFTFLAGNICFYIVIDDDRYKGLNNMYPLLRVVLLDGLFSIMGVILGVCIVLMYTTRAGKDVLDAQRVHKCWPLLMSVLLVLLFLSRAIYNIVAVQISDIHVFGDGSTFATDMADNEFYSSQGKNKYGYVAYFTVLLVWEIIPTYLIVVFFRIRKPSSHSRHNTIREDMGPVKGRHFFENPHRYDEVDQLLTSGTGHVSIPSVATSGYGSLSRQTAPNKYSINNPSSSASHSFMPGTTPPQLFTSPSFFTER